MNKLHEIIDLIQSINYFGSDIATLTLNNEHVEVKFKGYRVIACLESEITMDLLIDDLKRWAVAIVRPDNN